MKRFEGETFTVQHAGGAEAVDGLAGWRCEVCGEVEFDVASARRYAAKGDELVTQDRARRAQAQLEAE